MLKIREANQNDTPIILELIQDLGDYEKLSHEVIATEESLRQTIFEDGFASVFIAEWDSVPVGFSLYFYNYSTFLGKPGIHLEDLYVKEKYRGRGIGKALLKNLAKLASSKGYGRLEWNVLDWNESAINFYKSLGASPMNGWTTFRLTDNELKSLGKISS